jgi:hypothetical protein
MVERLFPRQILVFLGIFAGASVFIGIIGAALRHDDAANVFLSGVEAGVLAFVGGLLARSFISLLLWLRADDEGWAFLLGWAFFVWPGLFDLVARLFGGRLFTRPSVLLWIAATTGAFTGMMDGMWQIHNWGGAGWVAFPLDTTWGLAATTTGDLIHLIDFAWGDHAVGDPRTEAHRYKSGLGVKPGFVFTQGSVMSQAAGAVPPPGGTGDEQDLFAHESLHTWQNRIFGPFYLWSYLAWMIVFLIPGLIVGAILGDVGGGITAWSYFNNPWEVWGYSEQAPGIRELLGDGGVWSDAVAIPVGIVVLTLFLVVAIRLVYRTWTRAGSRA